MKKIIVIALFALCVGYAFWSCEKDDICAEGTATTPSLVIQFFNNENRTVARRVTNLRVAGQGMPGPILWGGAEAETVSDTIIRVPLRTGMDTTTYGFTNNSTATDGTRNQDIITFNYTRNEVYVSRACGYKTLFYLNDNIPGSSENPVLDAGGDGPWISEIVVVKPNIENENETHINIYF
jgi:hypothetical protein